MYYSFKELQDEAVRLGKRLERGAPDRPYGMRSGYIVWGRTGLWTQVATLRDAAKQIRLGR